MQNQAMKKVTGLSWFTPCRILLKKCKWLSVKQLIFYITVLQVHKTLTKGSPAYLHNKMFTEDIYNTRHQVKFGDRFPGKTDRSHISFCYRGAIQYNKVPTNITQCINISTFKRRLKAWIQLNIPIE